MFYLIEYFEDVCNVVNCIPFVDGSLFFLIHYAPVIKMYITKTVIVVKPNRRTNKEFQRSSIIFLVNYYENISIISYTMKVVMVYIHS